MAAPRSAADTRGRVAAAAAGLALLSLLLAALPLQTVAYPERVELAGCHDHPVRDEVFPYHENVVPDVAGTAFAAYLNGELTTSLCPGATHFISVSIYCQRPPFSMSSCVMQSAAVNCPLPAFRCWLRGTADAACAVLHRSAAPSPPVLHRCRNVPQVSYLLSNGAPEPRRALLTSNVGVMRGPTGRDALGYFADFRCANRLYLSPQGTGPPTGITVRRVDSCMHGCRAVAERQVACGVSAMLSARYADVSASWDVLLARCRHKLAAYRAAGANGRGGGCAALGCMLTLCQWCRVFTCRALLQQLWNAVTEALSQRHGRALRCLACHMTPVHLPCCCDPCMQLDADAFSVYNMSYTVGALWAWVWGPWVHRAARSGTALLTQEVAGAGRCCQPALGSPWGAGGTDMLC